MKEIFAKPVVLDNGDVLDTVLPEVLDAIERAEGSKVAKSSSVVDRLLEALREAGGSFVPLSKLGPQLGTDPAGLKAAVVQLARQGKVRVMALEGRYATPEDRRWAFSDFAFGDGRIGSVSLR